jgi:hypothetical protein
MNVPSKPHRGHITIHNEFEQGSEQWLAARCGLLTASEMKLIITAEGGGVVTKYRCTGHIPTNLTPTREKALEAIYGRVGTMKELSYVAEVSESTLRELLRLGALEAIQVNVPVSYRGATDDREKTHLYELLAQRITGYVEPHYISDDMLRGQEDEILARAAYSEHYAPVEEIGFITNDRYGFTLGYSPDGRVIGANAGIEGKSRRQKYQVQTLIEHVLQGTIPDDYVIQIQTGLIVAEWDWIDFISYSGGLHMPVIRVYPDPVIADAIINAAGEFERRLSEKLKLYHEALASNARLVATERREEEEIVI